MSEMSIRSSPFTLSGPARPDDLIGRSDLLAALTDRAMAGSFVVLTAPRRFGKTTLVHRLRRDAAVTEDLVVVLVDLMGILTLDDLAVRLARAWVGLPKGPIARAAASVLPYVQGLTINGGVVSLEVGRRDRGASGALEAVLDVPRAVAERTDRRILVVLDEFQEVGGVDRADGVIRSQIQHHTDRVSYLFAGSNQSTMDLLFTDRARPLYGQAEHVALPPFDPGDLADHVVRRLADTERDIAPDALSAYLAVVEGHPQRSMLVADALWGQVDDGGSIERRHVDDAVAAAVERSRTEFERLADFLAGSQNRALRLVAWGEPLTGAAARRLGLSQGSARSAIRVLVERGLVRRSPQGPPTVLDPLLGIWLRAAGPRP